MKQYHKVKQLQISEELLTGILCDGNEINVRIKSGLPRDAKIVNIFSDYRAIGIFSVVFESEEFEAVETGQLIPEMVFEIENLARMK